MLLSIRHETRYAYDLPQSYALQRLRQSPLSDRRQSVHSWEIEIEGARRELFFTDHFGNETWLLSAEAPNHEIVINARGTVEVSDSSGVVGFDNAPAPIWLYLRDTPLTRPAKDAGQPAGKPGNDVLSWLHGLMASVAAHMTFDTDATHAATTAAEAWEASRGVCQDYSHVFCGLARAGGVPARYVSGYLMMNDRIDQVASHAWSEAFVPGIGWVGFDCANGISPDSRYVRVACGLDYRDAAPVSGIRHGAGEEALAVHITVEQ